jgi:hypothetical protein
VVQSNQNVAIPGTTSISAIDRLHERKTVAFKPGCQDPSIPHLVGGLWHLQDVSNLTETINIVQELLLHSIKDLDLAIAEYSNYPLLLPIGEYIVHIH